MSDELLKVVDLEVCVDGVQILNGLSLEINVGEVHAIMGRNGSGKSTLAFALMGHPSYEITGGSILFQGRPLEELDVFERARAGMFLSFQYPQAIPGVQVGKFLRKSVQAIRGDNAPAAREFRVELNAAMEKLGVDKSFLSRYVNDGFSGGEKKRLEILQMLLLNPTLAILDETDSGLDIDALRTVAGGVNEITGVAGCLVITHYQRLLDYVKPDFVHIMLNGKIVKSGTAKLAMEVENQGYEGIEAEVA